MKFTANIMRLLLRWLLNVPPGPFMRELGARNIIIAESWR